MNPNLVVEVVIRTPYQCRATGYVIGLDRILTSGHLGKDEGLIEVGAEVEDYFDNDAPGKIRVQKTATVLWASCGELDCAVLECAEIPEFQRKQPGHEIRYEVVCAALNFSAQPGAMPGWNETVSRMRALDDRRR